MHVKYFNKLKENIQGLKSFCIYKDTICLVCY